jgi:hypothetical protein
MLCFIHIERAGGTTLHHVLRNNLLSFLTLRPSFWSNDAETMFTAGELQALLRLLPFTKGFGGHTTRVYADYERVTRQPVSYFTFVRDPITRYLSHFHYHVDRLDIPWTLESFTAEDRFSNFMTTRIAGTTDVNRAKQLLRSKFAFVGLTDRFDESLHLLRHSLGLPDFDLRYERQNVGDRAHEPAGSGAGTRPAPDDEALERVRAQNLLDIELYEFVRSELYPHYAELYGPSLAADVARFRGENEGFQFNPARRYAWGLYRKFGYEPIQEGVHRWQRQSARAAAAEDVRT